MSKSARHLTDSKRKSPSPSSRSPLKNDKTQDKKTPPVERTSQGTVEDVPEEAAP